MNETEWVNPFTKYEREPIKLSNHAVLLLQLFTKTDHLSDIWAWSGCETEADYPYERAAQQFIAQLEGHHCIAFIEALGAECNRLLAAHKAA